MLVCCDRRTLRADCVRTNGGCLRRCGFSDLHADGREKQILRFTQNDSIFDRRLCVMQPLEPGDRMSLAEVSGSC